METGWNATLHLDLVRHLSEARVAFVLPVLIEDRPLLWMVVRHRLIILSTYLFMGAGRLIMLLSWVPVLSGSTDWRQGKVEI